MFFPRTWIKMNTWRLFVLYDIICLTAAIQTTEILSKDVKLSTMVMRNPWKFYSSETGMVYVNSHPARTLLSQSTLRVRHVLALPIDAILLSRSQSMVTFAMKLITETVAFSKHNIYTWNKLSTSGSLPQFWHDHNWNSRIYSGNGTNTLLSTCNNWNKLCTKNDNNIYQNRNRRLIGSIRRELRLPSGHVAITHIIVIKTVAT
jgi:hypothetical protein